tara:strand:+ start:4954 stop:5919 length:966 start_codon:yes stop_codon:yes gene_type:complete
MKPIPSPMSREAFDLMNKAQYLSERIDMLEKEKCPKCENTKMGCAKMGCGGKMEKGLEMVEHEGKKVPKFAADGKGAKDMKAKADMATKDKYCMKNFGKKYSECSDKQKAQCDKAHGKADKDDKMKGDTFTIADAQRENAGVLPDSPPPRTSPMAYERMRQRMGGNTPSELEETETPIGRSTGDTIPLSEGKTRDQKRGVRGRGVKVFRRPGEESPKRMSPEQRNPPKEVAKSIEAGSQPGFITAYDSTPQGVMFMSETGGQTRNAYYTTNQYPYNAEDVTNKGATSVQVSLDRLAAMLNPHEGGGVSRLDNNGVLSNNPY